MRTFPTFPKRETCGTSSRGLTAIVWYASCALFVLAPVARAGSVVCVSEVCKTVAAIYDRTMSRKIKPCHDFFTFMCGGWLGKAWKKYNRSTVPMIRGTQQRLSEASDVILVAQLNRLLRRLDDAALGNIRDSELQSAHFYQSCLISGEEGDWELTTETLRKFFNEVDLPFFDQERTSEVVDGQRPTVLLTLLKLALQFGIEPIFKIDFGETSLTLSKSSHLDTENATLFPPYIAKLWKSELIDRSKSHSNDIVIRTLHASVFDAYRIHVTEGQLLRIGRNFEAVKWMFRNSFNQSTSFEDFNFNAYSEILQISYYDLFEKAVANLAGLVKWFKFKMVPSFFQPLIILTTDAEVYQIFDDFLGFWILQESFADMIPDTDCGLPPLKVGCVIGTHSKRSLYCAEAVSIHSTGLRGLYGENLRKC